ncbi:MAG: FAD-dependent monooxygenase, partial [Pseudomonadota bacterium]
GVTVTVSCPDGDYQIETDYLLACDGSRSPIRHMMGLDFEGRIFEDNFLIADVRFKQQRPAERWFRFDPPYPGDSSLIHKQPDGIWRLDFQLGWDIDKTEAVKIENVEPFVRGFLGPDVEYEYEWVSVYTFQCRRMERFVHNRVIFAGDSAHLVSPFGARGCNGGYADVDNLAWKLDLVLRGDANPDLLETYNHEALTTAEENILNSSRSTDFMTPKTQVSKVFRNAVLSLSRDHGFARPFVNSGRLSTPVHYPSSPLNGPDEGDYEFGPCPGSPCVDAPIKIDGEDAWLLSQLGNQFMLMCFTDDTECVHELSDVLSGIKVIQIGELERAGMLSDHKGLCHQRYGIKQTGYYLVRPDQYVAARWANLDVDAIRSAHQRAQAI